jgi:hypothetical protein
MLELWITLYVYPLVLFWHRSKQLFNAIFWALTLFFIMLKDILIAMFTNHWIAQFLKCFLQTVPHRDWTVSIRPKSGAGNASTATHSLTTARRGVWKWYARCGWVSRCVLTVMSEYTQTHIKSRATNRDVTDCGLLAIPSGSVPRIRFDRSGTTDAK